MISLFHLTSHAVVCMHGAFPLPYPTALFLPCYTTSSYTSCAQPLLKQYALPPKILKISPTIWQLGKNNLNTSGACCRPLYMQQAPMTPKNLRNSVYIMRGIKKV
jgi:hypothetical protein